MKDYRKALENAKRTISIQLEILGQDNENINGNLVLGIYSTELGESEWKLGNEYDRRRDILAGIGKLKEAESKSPFDILLKQEVGVTLFKFAEILHNSNDLAEALKQYRSTLHYLDVEQLRAKSADKIAKSKEAITEIENKLSGKK